VNFVKISLTFHAKLVEVFQLKLENLLTFIEHCGTQDNVVLPGACQALIHTHRHRQMYTNLCVYYTDLR